MGRYRTEDIRQVEPTDVLTDDEYVDITRSRPHSARPSGCLGAENPCLLHSAHFSQGLAEECLRSDGLVKQDGCGAKRLDLRS